jgi:hypothetical protein
MQTFIIFMSLLLRLVFSQEAPKISESFMAQIDITFVDKDVNFTAKGEGHVGQDEDLKSRVTELDEKFNKDNNLHYFELRRYDVNPPMEYVLMHINGEARPCQKIPLKSEYIPMWGWLSGAVNTGHAVINHHEVEMWNFTSNATNFKLAAGIEKRGPEVVPYYLYYKIGGNTSEMIFNEFHSIPPRDSHTFRIPEECENGGSNPVPKYFNFLGGLYDAIRKIN